MGYKLQSFNPFKSGHIFYYEGTYQNFNGFINSSIKKCNIRKSQTGDIALKATLMTQNYNVL